MMTKYQRRGNTYVTAWMTRGMLSIGKTNPERITIGMMKKNTAIIMACCCVRAIVEMNSPSPRVVSMKRSDSTYSTRRLPRTESPKSDEAGGEHEGDHDEADDDERRELPDDELAAA